MHLSVLPRARLPVRGPVHPPVPPYVRPFVRSCVQPALFPACSGNKEGFNAGLVVSIWPLSFVLACWPENVHRPLLRNLTPLGATRAQILRKRGLDCSKLTSDQAGIGLQRESVDFPDLQKVETFILVFCV